MIFTRLTFCAIAFPILTSGCAHSPESSHDAPIEVRSSIREDIDRSQIKTVAVLPFASPPGEFTVGENVADMLTTELMATGKFDVVERSRIKKMLEEQHFGLTGAVDAETAQKVGKLIGAQGIMIGSVGEYGRKISTDLRGGMLSTLSLSARLISVETGLVIWSASVSASSAKSRAELQAECIRKMGEDLTVKLKSPSQKTGKE